MDICYKVVVNDNGKFYSSNTALGHGRLQYKIGKRTSPKIANSKIFVFKDLSSAYSYTQFVQSGFKPAILKCFCEYSAIRNVISRLDVYFSVRLDVYSSVSKKTAFWNGDLDGNIGLSDKTRFANWVKPTSIIYEQNLL